MTRPRKPRAGSTALVAGVTLREEMGRDGYPRWRVRAVAQEGQGAERRQAVTNCSPLRYGLASAIRQACEWRAERAEGATPDELERACWDALAPDVVERMRSAGVDVSR